MTTQQVEAYEDEDEDALPPTSFEGVLRRTREPYSGWVGRTAEGYLADFEATDEEMRVLRKMLKELVTSELNKTSSPAWEES